MIAFGLLALLSGICAVVFVHLASKKDQSEYDRHSVTRGNIRASVLSTGLVKPENRLEIKPPIAGRIEDVLVHEGDHVKKGQILAWMSSTERAALIDAARSKGAANLAYWENLYKPSSIIAPIAGLLIARNVEPGQTLTAQDAAFVMSNRLIVKAQVDETDLGKITLGQKAEIVLDAFPQNVIAGTVAHIAYEAETINNVTIYQIDILPKEIPAFMRSGMSTNVRFVIAEHPAVLRLPLTVLQQRKNRNGVLLADGAKARWQSIQTGLDDGQYIEVLSGLAENDTVLTPKFDFDSSRPGGGNPLIPQRRRNR